MIGLLVVITLWLITPLRYVWQYGHDYVLYHLLTWAIGREEFTLAQLLAERRKKENLHNGKRVRRFNHQVLQKKASLRQLRSLRSGVDVLMAR